MHKARSSRRAFICMGASLSLVTLVGACAPAAAPTTSPAAATAAPTPVAPTAAAQNRATGGGRVFAVKPDQSEVILRIEEQLVGALIKNDAELRTQAIAGQITLLPDGRVGDGSKFTVDLTTLRSDRSTRDDFIKRNTLDTRSFPQAELTVREMQGLPSPLPASGLVSAQLIGDLTIRGVTRPVTLNVQGTLEGDTFRGSGTTEMTITEFGMTLPRVPSVASIEDLARLEVNLVAVAS